MYFDLKLTFRELAYSLCFFVVVAFVFEFEGNQSQGSVWMRESLQEEVKVMSYIVGKLKKRKCEI